MSTNVTPNTMSRTEWLNAGVAAGHLPPSLAVDSPKSMGQDTSMIFTAQDFGPILAKAAAKGLRAFAGDVVNSNKKLLQQNGIKTTAELANWMRNRMRAGLFPGESTPEDDYLYELAYEHAKRLAKSEGFSPTDPKWLYRAREIRDNYLANEEWRAKALKLKAQQDELFA